MKTKFIFSLFVGIVLSVSSRAQQYSFTTFTAPYVDLVSPVSLNQGIPWDDDDYYLTFAPMYFYMNPMSQLLISSNGLVSEEFIDSTYNISIYFADLVDRSTSMPSVSPISYEVTGNVGNQILKIEWKNAGFYWGNPLSFTNFQMWYYESDQAIELRMGPNNIPDTLDCFDGETGPLTGLYIIEYINFTASNSHWLSGPPAAPVVGPININTDVPLNGPPSNGTVYRFEPGTLGIDNKMGSNPISVFPNPAKDLLKINSKNEIELVEILDAKGMLVFTDAPKAFNYSANLSLLQSGMYFVRITGPKNISLQKLILE